MSIYDALYGQHYNPRRYWHLSELQVALNAACSELGDVRTLPENDPERMFLESLTEDTIEHLGMEMRRRIRGGQSLINARQEARRYPPELIARVKGAYDLRDVIAHDIDLAKPITGNICSPLREDHSPSFRAYADHWHDHGTGEHGDIIDWRMRWHGVTFWQAVESLAIEAGIPLPENVDVPRSATPTARTRHDRPRAIEFRCGKVVQR